jgi:hypothetical protein
MFHFRKKGGKKCLVVVARKKRENIKIMKRSSNCELTTSSYVWASLIRRGRGGKGVHASLYLWTKKHVSITLWALRYWPSMASVTSVNVSACKSWSKTVNKLDWWLFHRRQKRCEAILFAGVYVLSSRSLSSIIIFRLFNSLENSVSLEFTIFIFLKKTVFRLPITLLTESATASREKKERKNKLLCN